MAGSGCCTLRNFLALSFLTSFYLIYQGIVFRPQINKLYYIKKSWAILMDFEDNKTFDLLLCAVNLMRY